MASISGFSYLCSISAHKSSSSSSSSPRIPVRVFDLPSHGGTSNGNRHTWADVGKMNTFQRRRKVVRSVAGETLIPVEASTTDQPVTVPASTSDALTMFFQAEGTMNDAAIPTLTSALEETEGITNLKVQVVEGIASVELTKETTLQATGVASNLVEIIQGSGFKLQTLNLSFEDEAGSN